MAKQGRQFDCGIYVTEDILWQECHTYSSIELSTSVRPITALR